MTTLRPVQSKGCVWQERSRTTCAYGVCETRPRAPRRQNRFHLPDCPIAICPFEMRESTRNTPSTGDAHYQIATTNLYKPTAWGGVALTSRDICLMTAATTRRRRRFFDASQMCLMCPHQSESEEEPGRVPITLLALYRVVLPVNVTLYYIRQQYKLEY